jgi:DNA-directed RNA polymerase specialized sigma24 family protein
MIAARRQADVAAELYRAQVRETVAQLAGEGWSQRQIAAALSITEGSLRALLRPEGTARRR